MKHYHLKRLEALLELLKTNPPKHFDLDTWRSERIPPCGTTFCAVGWAASQRSFRRKGLVLIENQIHYTKGEKTVRSWGAVATFFGLDANDAWRLFSPYNYNSHVTSPEPVIARLEAFIKEHTHAPA